jgi:hypothetical protein
MATYTVTGHPVNYTDIGLTQASIDLIHNALALTGVGQTITVTLPGPDDTKIKAHGCLK